MIVAYSAQSSAHDRYFFKNKNAMIAGAVEPSRVDLQNKELVEAHIHSTWLARVGILLGSSLTTVIVSVDSQTRPIKDMLNLAT